MGSLVGKRVRLLVAHDNEKGERFLAGEEFAVASTWRDTVRLESGDARIGVRLVPRKHVLLMMAGLYSWTCACGRRGNGRWSESEAVKRKSRHEKQGGIHRAYVCLVSTV